MAKSGVPASSTLSLPVGIAAEGAVERERPGALWFAQFQSTGRLPPMALWKPDPTFYPSPRMAAEGPREKLAYVGVFNPEPSNGKHDSLCVIDTDQRRRLPRHGGAGRRRRCLGWATRSIVPGGTRAAQRCARTRRIRYVEWRYLLAPDCDRLRRTVGNRTSSKLVKVIEAAEIAARARPGRPAGRPHPGRPRSTWK